MKIGKVEVSPGFLLLAAWLNYTDRQGLFWVGMVSCLLHECGHLTVLCLLKNGVKSIRLTVCGAAIGLSRGLSYGSEILAAAAGPAVNLGLAGVLCQVPGMETAAGMNVVLAVFNLLPVGKLDGGRILRCMLCWLLGPERGEVAAERSSRIMTAVVSTVGIVVWRLGGNLTLLLASAWLLKGNMENRGRKRTKK